MKKNPKNLVGIGARVTDILWDFESARIEEYDSETQEVATVRYIPFNPFVTQQSRVACVIGAAREKGIGNATAQTLCRRYQVVGLDNDSSALNIMREKAPQVTWVQGDAGCERHMERLMEQIHSRFGKLNYLICNAGGTAGKSPSQDNIWDLTLDDFEEIWRANVLPVFLPVKYALRRFAKQLDLVVVLGSETGQLGVYGQMAYGMSKASLTAMMKICTAQATSTRWVEIRPGMISTQSPNYKERLKKFPNWNELESSMIPAGRLGTPGDIANLISFLCSPAAEYINGAVLSATGGLEATGPMFPGIDPLNFRESYVRAVGLWEKNEDSKAA